MPTPTPPSGGATDPPGGSEDGPDPTHTLALGFEYATERRARIVADSIRVETGEVPDDRSRARVDRDGRVVEVDVAAADLVALRAGANTWLRLVGVAEDVASAATDEHIDDRTGSSRDDGD